MGSSNFPHNLERVGVESGNQKRVVAGIAFNGSSNPILDTSSSAAAAAGNRARSFDTVSGGGGGGGEEDCPATPTTEESKIPRVLDSPPPPPRKPKRPATKRPFNGGRVFFTTPDLDAVFIPRVQI